MTSHKKPDRTLKIGASLMAALMATTMLTGIATATLPANSGQTAVVTSEIPISFADLVAQTRPAVVSVIVEKGGLRPKLTTGETPEQLKEFFERFQMPKEFGRNFKMPFPRKGHPLSGQGSGFLISSDGYIVTNNHVIDGATEIKVRFLDKRTSKATLVGSDPKTDLAVLKVEGNNFKYVKFGNSDATRVGDWVVALGNPFGLNGSATAGIVSARGRYIGSGPYDEFIQIDASINQGNSGGPTFNRHGEVIGVNTAIFSPSGGSVGIGFAVPSNVASDIVDNLIKHGKVKRGWLGVMVQPITKDLAQSLELKSQDGALISMVTEKSPARASGLKPGDVIIAVGNTKIKTPRELSKVIAGAGPSKTVKLEILRDGRQQFLDVALAETETKTVARSDDSQKVGEKAKLGLLLNKTDKGLVVAEVMPGSPAAEKGLRSGDIIAKASGKTVQSVADIGEAIAAANGGPILLLIKNKHGTRFVAIKPAKSVG